MTSPTPDIAELLELPWRVWPPEERATRPADTYDVLVVSGSEVRVNLTFAAASSIVAAVNALPALLDAAVLLADVREQVARGALCPMCSTGMTRRTVGLVCPVCGTDYARPEYASLRRDSEETSKAVLADALAVRAERDEIAGRLAELLCDLTGGRLSKTTYPVPVMVQEIEQYLSECHESDLKDERDELAAKVERVRALHYAADNDGARTPICETCHGKAGVHECGCWAERDREPVCGHCMDGWHGASVPWPCPTIRALDEEADR